MNEGTSAVLIIGDESYEVSYYKIKERVEDKFFEGALDLTLDDNMEPDLEPGEPYVARLEVNGDAVWYFPWVWFEKTDLPQMKATTHGAIFCPLGLSDEDEEKYDSINLIIASDVCHAMTAEVWKNLLDVFSDWLKSKSVPQHQEFLDLSESIEIPEDELLDDEEYEEDEEDEDEEDDEN